MELDKVEIENNLVFLERCQLTGKEAETMVKLRYKLISMRDEILEAEKLQAEKLQAEKLQAEKLRAEKLRAVPAPNGDKETG